MLDKYKTIEIIVFILINENFVNKHNEMKKFQTLVAAALPQKYLHVFA